MAAAFKQHVSQGIPFEGEWHAFFGFLREHIPHIKVVHKLDIDRMDSIKARLTKQRSAGKAREWYDERCASFKKNLVQLESSPYLSKIKEETYMHTFALTPEYQSRLLALIEPQHFSSENPYFETFELNQQQLESVSHIKPLLDGVYNPDSNSTTGNAIKEVHIDVKYEELFTKTREENIWLLTQTWSIPDNIQNNIPNSGTEFIKIPCLKPEFILPEKFDFRTYLQLHNHISAEPSSSNTLCGQILYTLTSLYCEEHTRPDQWQRIQPGILHNAAQCYFHRSPQLIGILAPFERKHWVFEDYNLDSRLYAMIDELRKSK